MYKLLIVDDEPLVQVGIKSMLNWADLNIEVVGTAVNGQAALKMVSELAPDIVITDIKMPVMSGLELIRQCRELYGSEKLFYYSDQLRGFPHGQGSSHLSSDGLSCENGTHPSCFDGSGKPRTETDSGVGA